MTLKLMSAAKRKQKQHEILVNKLDLTTRSLSPTSDELFELMHLTSCDHAIKRWKEQWLLCPVCNGSVKYSVDSTYGLVGYIEHKRREDILV